MKRQASLVVVTRNSMLAGPKDEMLLPHDVAPGGVLKLKKFQHLDIRTDGKYLRKWHGVVAKFT